MKISRKAPRAQAAPPGNRPAHELSEEEKAERVGQAMREARAAAQEEEQKAYSRSALRALMEHRNRRPKELEHASVMEYVIANPGEDMFIDTIVLDRPSRDLVTLMEITPTRFTGLQWDALDASFRAEMLTQLGEDLCKVTASSVLEALPSMTLDYLLGWQRQINHPSANVWTCGQTCIDQAYLLITDGFCLRPTQTLDTRVGLVDGRDDVPPGSSGTAAFVKAVMGEAYLVWLQQQEAA